MSSGIEAIEHPIQKLWREEGSRTARESGVDLYALENRFVGTGIPFQSIVDAIDQATARNHSHRLSHERDNLGRLGLDFDTVKRHEDDPVFKPSPDYDAYKSNAGRPGRMGEHIVWFGRIARRVFNEVDKLPPDQRPFNEILLELGGNTQFGDWEATRLLEAQIEDLPRQIFAAEPNARLTLHGAPKDGKELHAGPNVRYIDRVIKSYSLYPKILFDEEARPRFNDNGELALDVFMMIRRRRPAIDVDVPDGSRVIVFKESLGVLVMQLLPEEIRRQIRFEYGRQILKAFFENTGQVKDKRLSNPESENRDGMLTAESERVPKKKSDTVKMADTRAAIWAGSIFERGIRAPIGKTYDIIPTSAHCVMGVGEKFARLELPGQ